MSPRYLTEKERVEIVLAKIQAKRDYKEMLENALRGKINANKTNKQP